MSHLGWQCLALSSLICPLGSRQTEEEKNVVFKKKEKKKKKTKLNSLRTFRICPKLTFLKHEIFGVQICHSFDYH